MDSISVTTTNELTTMEPSVDGKDRPQALVEEHVTVIRPPSGWQLVNVRELWRYRELLYFLIWRDVKVRYKQTLLGAAWAVLQPTMMMVVFTVFFGRLAKLLHPEIAVQEVGSEEAISELSDKGTRPRKWLMICMTASSSARGRRVCLHRFSWLVIFAAH